MTATDRTLGWRITSAAVAAVAVVGLAVPSQGTLLVYEGFDYELGNLTGLDGGKGFAGGWLNSNGLGDSGRVWDETTAVTFDNVTLDWDGALNNEFPTSPAEGIRYLGAEPDSGISNLNIYRQLSASAGAMAGPDGVLWMSVVYHLPNRTFGAGVHIGFGSGWMRERSRQFETADTDFIGASPYSGASNVWNTGNLWPVIVDTNTGANAWENFTRTQGPALPAASLDMIVVLKFTFGASDTVEGWVFSEDVPLQQITEAAFDANKVGATYAAGIDAFGLNYLVINQGRFNNALDEIRIGTTFDSVTKLPSKATLISIL